MSKGAKSYLLQELENGIGVAGALRASDGLALHNLAISPSLYEGITGADPAGRVGYLEKHLHAPTFDVMPAWCLRFDHHVAMMWSWSDFWRAARSLAVLKGATAKRPGREQPFPGPFAPPVHGSLGSTTLETHMTMRFTSLTSSVRVLPTQPTSKSIGSREVRSQRAARQSSRGAAGMFLGIVRGALCPRQDL